MIHYHPNLSGAFAKRVFDLFFSAYSLVILSPFLLAIAIAIKLTNPGPIFYKAKRVGLNGRPFLMFKFRTMVLNADKGPASTPDDDDRITRIGKVLRKYKLDELPQLINVFLGEMSLVGPRPQISWVVQLYTESEKVLLHVRPGMTDLASITFSNEGEILRGSKDPDGDYLRIIAPEKIRLGVEYVRRKNMRLDAEIILRTVGVILGFPFVSGFPSITEQWGMLATPEQLSMAYCRYHLAGIYASGKQVLEVACGAGIGLDFLSSKSTILVAGDYAHSNLQSAKLRTLGKHSLVQLDAQFLPFQSNYFDTIICHEAIYYLPSIPNFLKECKRVLRKPGRLILSLPNRNRPGFIPSPLSTSYPSVPELSELLDKLGFRADILGGYPICAASLGSSIKSAARTFSAQLGLVPKTMAMRSRLKSLFNRQMTPQMGIREHMAEIPELVRLSKNTPTTEFKNLYVVAEYSSSNDQCH